MKPTLEELPYTVRDIRHITDNVATVMYDVKVLAASVRQAGENIHRASGYIEAATSTSVVHMSGLKAGIRAGIGVLIRNVVSKQKNRSIGGKQWQMKKEVMVWVLHFSDFSLEDWWVQG